ASSCSRKSRTDGGRRNRSARNPQSQPLLPSAHGYSCFTSTPNDPNETGASEQGRAKTDHFLLTSPLASRTPRRPSPRESQSPPPPPRPDSRPRPRSPYSPPPPDAPRIGEYCDPSTHQSATAVAP